MLREKVQQEIIKALDQLGLKAEKVEINYPEANFGDYSTNVALILRADPNLIADKIDKSMFEKVEVVKPGFINFRLKVEELTAPSPGASHHPPPKGEGKSEKILLEYFQPNIAKPLHVGHLRTAVIGDCIKRMLLYLGYHVESDTHMGDWGTQFGYLILAQKKFGEVNEKIYAELNADESMRDAAKQEFVKLEQGDVENRKIWQSLVETSMKEFLQINDLMDILPFDHHWPESFYEDKMPAVLETLKKCKLLAQSQGAQIVDLSASAKSYGGSAEASREGGEKQGLGVAVIVKSDGGTTYLLRDLATFIFIKQQGFGKHLYVVDNRQALHYRQLFTILKLMGQINEDEGTHINYGFISFKGEALSTRKGNMVKASDLIMQAEEKVAKVIAAKNPDLKNKQQVIKAVTKAALKYFDLKHNRHSDIEFDWDEVLDFEGDSGPYLQYAYARLSSILKKSQITNNKSQINSKFQIPNSITATERELLFKLSILPEVVEDALKDYLPNILAHYLYDLATLINKFYHESPVIAEPNEDIKNFRLGLIAAAKNTLGQGLDLLGIKALEEM